MFFYNNFEVANQEDLYQIHYRILGKSALKLIKIVETLDFLC